MKNIESVPNSVINYFCSITDPRVDNFNKRHLLIDVITITICAVICGCETWEEIADYGEIKHKWFKKFLKLPNGIPSHDTFRRIFMLLCPNEFNIAFVNWSNSLRNGSEKDIIPLDGKSIRGSASPLSGQKAVHLVSAWSTKNGIVLGQKKVDDKSNEIVAIPDLIDLIDIKDSTVTIDAIGCQTKIAEKIIDNGGDYVLALKNNQKSFYERVNAAFDHGFENDFKNIDYSFYQERNQGHGRIEERNYFKINDISFLKRETEWKGLSAIGMAESVIIKNGKVSTERRYYITSLDGTAEELGKAVRSHWQIENNLHWRLDVQFGDDSSKKREKNSSSNFSTVKRISLNLLKKCSVKWSNRKKRLKAMLDNQFLLNIILGKA